MPTKLDHLDQRKEFQFIVSLSKFNYFSFNSNLIDSIIFINSSEDMSYKCFSNANKHYSIRISTSSGDSLDPSIPNISYNIKIPITKPSMHPC